jgi:hypothetical protein
MSRRSVLLLLLPLLGACSTHDVAGPASPLNIRNGGLTTDAAAYELSTYRLVLHGLVFNYDDARHGFGEPVPVEYRTSNLFALNAP